MFAAAKKVTNLIWLVDDNKKQLDGYTKDILPILTWRRNLPHSALTPGG